MVAGCFRGSPFHLFITHLTHLSPVVFFLSLLLFCLTLFLPSPPSPSPLLSPSAFARSFFPSSSSHFSFPHPPPPSLCLQLAYLHVCVLAVWARSCQNLLCVCVCARMCMSQQMCQRVFALLLNLCTCVFIRCVCMSYGNLCVCGVNSLCSYFCLCVVCPCVMCLCIFQCVYVLSMCLCVFAFCVCVYTSFSPFQFPPVCQVYKKKKEKNFIFLK